MGFAKNLCALMDKKDISSYKLSKTIGVHISTITNWKDGKTPKLEHIKAVADYFEVSVDSLLK